MLPLDMHKLKHRQSIIGVSLLAKLVAEYGLAAEPMLVRAGIPLAQLSDPKAHISLQQDIDFVSAMLAAINDPVIGLKAGKRYPISAFGTIGLAAVSSETVEAAIHVFLKYIKLSFTHFDVSFFKSSGQAFLRFSDQYDLNRLRRFYLERDFSFVVVSTRDMFPRSLESHTIKMVHFDFECPTSVKEYEAFYECPVKFSMPYNQIVMDEGYLDLPLPQANALTQQLLEEQCESQRLDILGPQGYEEKVRQIIIESHQSIPNLEAIAVQFNSTSRTVRRKLKEQGYSFQELLAEEFSRKSILLLQTTHLTIEQISARLGYSESASFIHAFKRWTGKTPKMYR